MNLMILSQVTDYTASKIRWLCSCVGFWKSIFPYIITTFYS